MTSDPLRAVWEALDQAGCDPHGKPYDYRAKCPGHDGDNPDALHVSEGADRRVVLYCFRGCDASTVVDALGLQIRDLFVPGHPLNRRRAKPRPSKRGRLEIVLEGLDLIGIGVRGMWVLDQCPYCDEPGCWLWCDRDGVLQVDCTQGCVREDIFGALETLVAIKEAGHDIGR